MANYKEELKQVKIEGTEYKWTRCNKIEIDNKFGKIPCIKMSEETLKREVDNTIKKIAASLIEVAYVANEEIPAIDPESLQPIPGMSFTSDQIYLALFSYYIKKAKERDAKSNT